MSSINKNSPIGFFDSGVGGLTVLDKVKKLLPHEKYIFYGDTLHVPYGDKTKDELLSYSSDILNFFEDKGCKAVVMACNTTSSLIYDDIKDKYSFKLYPVVQSVAKIIANLNVNRLGVFATKATISSNAYPNEIAKYNNEMKVFGQYCPSWVRIVENNLINNPEIREVVINDLKIMLQNNPQKIILGCTHYPYLKDILSDYVHNIEFIDPAIPLAEYIKDDLSNLGLCSDKNSGEDEFYVSDNPKKFKEAAKMFYHLAQDPHLLIF